MGCVKCGHQGSSIRCCLCNLTAKTYYSWGKERKICYRCKENMERKVEAYKKEIHRIQTLLRGEEWSIKKYEKEMKNAR